MKITAYVAFIQKDGAWRYAGTHWTLKAVETVLGHYAARGYTGKYETQERW